MRYVANLFCEGLNMYVIPNLVSYNFQTDRFPKVQVRNIGEAKDLQMWAAAMANLVKNNAIQIDDETEQWIRKQMDMPKRTTPYKEKSTQTADGQNQNGARGPQTTSGNVGDSPNTAK